VFVESLKDPDHKVLIDNLRPGDLVKVRIEGEMSNDLRIATINDSNVTAMGKDKYGYYNFQVIKIDDIQELLVETETYPIGVPVTILLVIFYFLL
jgi:hypothetical protein